MVLLHPSPLSSTFMEPLLELFSSSARAIAWDAPGYGQSDKLSTQEEGLTPYVEALNQFIDTLGLEKPVIYGSATGAQIAIEYGKSYPGNISGLLLENAAWFYQEERDEILERYFPDIHPQRDGSHLQQTWQMVSQLYNYFPWFDTSDAALVNPNAVPVELIHQTAVDYLIAGPDYARAYRAAFMNEDPKQLQPLVVPTHIVRWDGSLLKKYVSRLEQAELPDNIQIHPVEASLEARFDKLQQLQQVLSLG